MSDRLHQNRKRIREEKMLDSEFCKMAALRRVQFGEVTVIVIPPVEKDVYSTLWWSQTDIKYFRERKQQEKLLKEKLSSMTLVITNDAKRRASLAFSSFKSSGCPHSMYIACEHYKLEHTLEVHKLYFQRIVIDGQDTAEWKKSEELVQKYCPTAYVLTVCQG